MLSGFAAAVAAAAVEGHRQVFDLPLLVPFISCCSKAKNIQIGYLWERQCLVHGVKPLFFFFFSLASVVSTITAFNCPLPDFHQSQVFSAPPLLQFPPYDFLTNSK